MEDDDLNRKDDHLTKHAALCNVETGTEVMATDDGTVNVHVRDKNSVLTDDEFELTPFQARLLAETLLEVADLADSKLDAVQ